MEKSVRSFLRKLVIDIPYDPAVPFLDTSPKESKAVYNRDTGRTIFFIIALIHISHAMEPV
jgi:hypothetical protein